MRKVTLSNRSLRKYSETIAMDMNTELDDKKKKKNVFKHPVKLKYKQKF